MKHVFYLKDEIEFFQPADEEIIVWIFRWTANGRQNIAYSALLRELIENNYTTN